MMALLPLVLSGCPAGASSGVTPTSTPEQLVLPTPTAVKNISTDCNLAFDDLRSAINTCSEITINWACYAKPDVIVSPDEVRFAQPGDRQPLEAFDKINTGGEGIVIMNLAVVNEQDPISFIAFGDADTAEFATLTLSGGQLMCGSLPPGLSVQTESGVQGIVTVNGVEIELQ